MKCGKLFDFLYINCTKISSFHNHVSHWFSIQILHNYAELQGFIILRKLAITSSTSLPMLHVMQRVYAACRPYCIVILLVHAAFPCCMPRSMLHEITVLYRVWLSIADLTVFFSMYRSSSLIKAYGSPGQYWLVCAGLLAVHLFIVQYTSFF